MGIGNTRADAGRDTPPDAGGAGRAGRGDGRGGGGGAGCRDGADRRRDGAWKRHRFQAGADQSDGEYQKSFLAARRIAAGKVADPGKPSGGLCRSAHGASAEHPAVLDRAAGDSGKGRLRIAAGGGVAALWMVGDRLHGGVAVARVAPQDEPAGSARRVQGDRGQPANPEPHSQPAAPDAPPPREGRCVESGSGAHQSHALRRRAGLRLRDHGSAEGDGQGAKSSGRGDQGRGPLGRRADCREPAAGALALSHGRSRPVDPGRALCSGGRDSGLPLPAARGGRIAALRGFSVWRLRRSRF